jgi:predicted acetyltransferase
MVLRLSFSFLDTTDLRTNEIMLKLEKTIPDNPETRWAPTYHFTIYLASDKTEIGHCDLRIGNTEKLYFGGNIGYTVYHAFRGHHYAGKACLLLLTLARKHGLSYLYITCDPINCASRRTCEYAGGILQSIIHLPTDNDMYLEGVRKICIYFFKL